MTDGPISDGDSPPRVAQAASSGWMFLFAALIAVELVVISLLYTNNFPFICRDVAPAALCEFLSLSVMRAIVFLGACLIFAFARPAIRRALFQSAQTSDRHPVWVWVQLAGFILIILPWTFTADGAAPMTLIVAFSFWITGGLLATLGAGFVVAPPARWCKTATDLGPIPLAILVVTVISPEITDLARGIWWIEPLTQFTFQSVVFTLDMFGVSAIARPEDYVLYTSTFAIGVGSQCSGVEGFALITFFMLCYFYAFRADLRFPHVWLLLPLGLVLSWMLNVVRIAVLFAIGSRYSPDLAINGFHSYAGWLMFSILALSIIGISRTVPWFQRTRDTRPALLPLRQDWIAARIVPFAAFMGASLLLSTFTEIPDVWYVVKVVFMASALALFLPLYARIAWRVDPLALAAGLAIGLIWLVTNSVREAGDGQLETALAALPAGLLGVWIVLRVTGTAIIVPMVEELFFRGYVLDRIDSLDKGGLALRLLALGVSAGLFAMLHDRWILAAIVGVVYGLIYLRNRRIADAVIAHAASNAVIAAYAMALSDWSVI